MTKERVFFPHLNKDVFVDLQDKKLLDALCKRMKSHLKKERGQLLAHLEASQLRERDGAAPFLFKKWEPLIEHKKNKKRIVLDVHGAGPGGGISAHLLKTETFLVLEGLILAAYLLDISEGYIYIPAAEKDLIHHLDGMIALLREKGVLGTKEGKEKWFFNLEVHYGDAQFIGEGDAFVLRSMDAQSDGAHLFDGLGCVLQPETAALLPQVLEMKTDAFLGIGTVASKGHKVIALSGHVNRPGFVEVPFGTSVKHVIAEACRGVRGGWSHVQMIFPNSVFSGAVLKDGLENMAVSYEFFEQQQLSLGRGEMVVVNQSIDKTDAYLWMADFFSEAPLDACFICQKGLPWLQYLIQSYVKLGDRQIHDDIQAVYKDLMADCCCHYKHSYSSLIQSLIQQVTQTQEVLEVV